MYIIYVINEPLRHNGMFVFSFMINKAFTK